MIIDQRHEFWNDISELFMLQGLWVYGATYVDEDVEIQLRC